MTSVHFRVLALFLTAVSGGILRGEVLKDAFSSWEFLLARDALGDPIDPNRLDADFAATWVDPVELGYDGPAFSLGEGYFGYGVIDGSAISTNLWNPDGRLATNEPPSGARYTVYFRTVVIPDEPVTYLRFTGLIDDGAIVYVNGSEFARLNMDPAATAPDSWTLLSAAGGSETSPVTAAGPIDLPAGQPVRIAVSVHNTSATSSDLGFDLLVESVEPMVPSNDLFAAAEPITGPLPYVGFGTNSDGVGRPGAGKEADEPDHAGDAGGSSVWWTWTPDTSGRVSVSTDGSDFATLLAVYTGDAVGLLSPVSRYPNLFVPAASAEEPFHPASRIEFDAVAGTTYRIAVDGASGAWGSIQLAIDPVVSLLDPVAELVPAGSDWEYLLYVDPTNLPVDPGTVDPDFHSTWHTSALYDGPDFAGPAPALLGYGVINADPIRTDLWDGLDHDGDLVPDNEPPSGLRYTTYFRTTFTPSVPVENLAFEGLIDDGAIIYINGEESARINVDPTKDPSLWLTVADSANHGPGNIGNEEEAQVAFDLGRTLPAGIPVELAVSLHNPNGTSSDMGFDLRVFAVNPPPKPPVPADFQVEVRLTAVPGEVQLSWSNSPGALYHIDFSEDLESWVTIIFAIPADLSGANVEFDFPGVPTGFYRVVQE